MSEPNAGVGSRSHVDDPSAMLNPAPALPQHPEKMSDAERQAWVEEYERHLQARDLAAEALDELRRITPEGRRREIERLRAKMNVWGTLAAGIVSKLPEEIIATLGLPVVVVRCAFLLQRERIDQFGDALHESDTDAVKLQKQAQKLAEWERERIRDLEGMVPPDLLAMALKFRDERDEDLALLDRIRSKIGESTYEDHEGNAIPNPFVEDGDFSTFNRDEARLVREAEASIGRHSPPGFLDWLKTKFYRWRKAAPSQSASRIRLQLLDRDGSVLDELLTLEDAAVFLGVSKGRISQLINDGTLPKHRLNDRCYLLASRDLQRYRDSDRRPGPKSSRF